MVQRRSRFSGVQGCESREREDLRAVCGENSRLQPGGQAGLRSSLPGRRLHPELGEAGGARRFYRDEEDSRDPLDQVDARPATGRGRSGGDAHGRLRHLHDAAHAHVHERDRRSASRARSFGADGICGGQVLALLPGECRHGRATWQALAAFAGVFLPHCGAQWIAQQGQPLRLANRDDPRQGGHAFRCRRSRTHHRRRLGVRGLRLRRDAGRRGRPGEAATHRGHGGCNGCRLRQEHPCAVL
mmetsp:Transcript_70577/g.187670  ORF Transcript_70577/g.187670 Transcript_70577/m.187670 type:complete len:243 (+) Transcript_70577:346-1074(+)